MRPYLIAAVAPIVLSACVAAADNAVAPVREITERPPLAVPVCPTETRNLRAWVNAMPGPGSPPTLIVEGEALLPESASVTMRAGPLDKMQPPVQRVEIAVEPSKMAAGWQVARVEIPTALTEYAAVVVTCDGIEFARIAPVAAAY